MWSKTGLQLEATHRYGAAGTYRVGQEVQVSGIVIHARSNGATVQAQFIRLKSSGDGG